MAIAEWRSKANCRDMEPELFFREADKNPNNGWPLDVVNACNTCPVMGECLTWALHNEEYGYWGGMGPNQRRSVRRKMRIALGDAPTNVRNFISVKYG